MFINFSNFLRFKGVKSHSFRQLHVDFCPLPCQQNSTVGKIYTQTPTLFARKVRRLRPFTRAIKPHQGEFNPENIKNFLFLRKVFIQFFTDGRPYQIRLARVLLPQNGTASKSKQEHLDEPMEAASNVKSDSQLQFVNINSARIPGESFLRKLDHIYTIFSS